MESNLIFTALVHNRDYATKVLPFLQEEYFQKKHERELVRVFREYTENYHDLPTIEVLEYEISRARGLNQSEYNEARDFVSSLRRPFKSPEMQFLLDETEKFCVNRSVYNAITKCISIIDDDSKVPQTAIPDILKEALAVSFDTDVGHDYSSDVEDRFRKLHEQTARIPWGHRWLDKVFGGGLPRKTLSFFLAQSGGGKSLFKTHFATHFFQQGYNVLYVTLELSEERIGERIDANALNVDVVDIPKIDLETYKKKISGIAKSTKGRLIIKEYPPTTVTTQHLRALLDELKLKRNFVPDVVMIDYLNLMASSRYKAASGANSYTILKAVAEELRGLACERNFACITSTQMNRSAISGSDPDMTGVSDSLGMVMTADAMIAIVRSDELDEMGQVILKCLKTRFSDLTNHKTAVGVEWNKMKVLDIDSDKYIAQSNTPKPEDVPKKPAFMKATSNKKVQIEV